eukprot:COSAG04_NODE_27690_length_280_cov_1.657459_1_plen_31_part_10
MCVTVQLAELIELSQKRRKKEKEKQAALALE